MTPGLIKPLSQLFPLLTSTRRELLHLEPCLLALLMKKSQADFVQELMRGGLCTFSLIPNDQQNSAWSESTRRMVCSRIPILMIIRCTDIPSE